MNEIVFEVYENAKAKAIIKDGKLWSIKLLFKSPRRFYYSFMNDAEMEFLKQYPQYL